MFFFIQQYIFLILTFVSIDLEIKIEHASNEITTTITITTTISKLLHIEHALLPATDRF